MTTDGPLCTLLFTNPKAELEGPHLMPCPRGLLSQLFPPSLPGPVPHLGGVLRAGSETRAAAFLQSQQSGNKPALRFRLQPWGFGSLGLQQQSLPRQPRVQKRVGPGLQRSRSGGGGPRVRPGLLFRGDHPKRQRWVPQPAPDGQHPHSAQLHPTDRYPCASAYQGPPGSGGALSLSTSSLPLAVFSPIRPCFPPLLGLFF